MEVYGYVYMVRNKVNGKIYFGITENDFDTRYRKNIAKYTHNEHLQNSIKKYGIENFEINEQFDVAYNEDDLYDLEDMYICIYNTLDDGYGYNKRRSGSKHKGHGKASEETKRKNSDSQKALYEQGYVNPMYGKHHTEETKKKISDGRKGKYIGEDSSFYGKQHSEETKRKISNKRQEKGLSRGEKNPMYGKHHTEETKCKLSEIFSVKVICLETKQIFNSLSEASAWAGGNVNKCCKGKQKSAGKHPETGERLHWMYYDEYLEQQNKNNEDLVINVA